jgi:transposase
MVRVLLVRIGALRRAVLPSSAARSADVDTATLPMERREMNDRASAVLSSSSGRVRKALIQERVREANRVHGLLEDTGIELVTVASDVFGMSGRAIVVPVEELTAQAEAFR